MWFWNAIFMTLFGRYWQNQLMSIFFHSIRRLRLRVLHILLYCTCRIDHYVVYLAMRFELGNFSVHKILANISMKIAPIMLWSYIFHLLYYLVQEKYILSGSKLHKDVKDDELTIMENSRFMGSMLLIDLSWYVFKRLCLSQK